MLCIDDWHFLADIHKNAFEDRLVQFAPGCAWGLLIGSGAVPEHVEHSVDKFPEVDRDSIQ